MNFKKWLLVQEYGAGIAHGDVSMDNPAREIELRAKDDAMKGVGALPGGTLGGEDPLPGNRWMKKGMRRRMKQK
jgi:hypothetical protein